MDTDWINQKLRKLYQDNTTALLEEWIAAFPQETPPCRINEFGIIDPEHYNGTLCICRETNGWSNEDYEQGILFRPWLEQIAKNGLSGRGQVRRHPNLWYNLSRWLLLLQETQRDMEELSSLKTTEPLRTMAFTNVNKVRGKARSAAEYQKLAASPITRELLRQEIELLRPEIILCGGTADIVKELLPSNFKGKLYEMPHPGCRKNKKILLTELKQQLESMENL